MGKITRDGRIVMFTAGTIGMALLLFGYLSLTWGSFAGITKAIYAFSELFSDFVIYYYPMGEAIFQTELPVSGYLYSPFIAILLAIFPLLGQPLSLVLWGILQILFVVLYLLLFRRLVPSGLKFQLLFVALTLFSFPLVLNLLGGQVSVFIIVGILGLLVLEERGFRSSGAGLLAFAVSFKFYPILFLTPFASRRKIRVFFLGGGACVALLFVVPGIFLGIGDTFRFYGALLSSFKDSGWVTENPHSQYFPHLILRLTGMSEHDLLYLISYSIAAANMGLVFLIQRARLRLANLWSFQIVFMTIPFVLKTSWAHDFVFISFTQALLVWWLLEGKKGFKGTDTAKAVTYVLLLLSIVFSNIVFFNVFGDFLRYGYYGFLFWANLFLLIATYIQILPPALSEIQKLPAESNLNPLNSSF
ncbi:glycosyltransferase family 87 protein [Acidobacteriota bacterium]